jgi:antitoxin component YwqK of YwqJK toxin-antitoxin module
LTIDSLSQLKKYDFIALVKITDDQDYKKPTENDYESIGKLTITIIELFKGKKTNIILEYSKYSSCDMGIDKGEEWVLFGRLVNGNIKIDACDRNMQYKEVNETRDWEYGRGFYELRQLRKLYEHPFKKYENEKHTEKYSNGQLEIEETYKNGKLNGQRTIWYPNGKVMCKQLYVNDTLDGKAEWFYESGQVSDEDYYFKGEPCNVSRMYYD